MREIMSGPVLKNALGKRNAATGISIRVKSAMVVILGIARTVVKRIAPARRKVPYQRGNNQRDNKMEIAPRQFQIPVLRLDVP